MGIYITIYGHLQQYTWIYITTIPTIEGMFPLWWVSVLCMFSRQLFFLR